MKQKMNARQKRDAETLRRKGAFLPKTAEPVLAVPEKPAPIKTVLRKENIPAKSPEEEAREFLAYLDKYGAPDLKEEEAQAPRKKAKGFSGIPRLNVKEDMPVVSDALDRMRMGLQEMRSGRVKVVKLIHGYGSTGRGGKIRISVREELASMKRRRQIRDFIPGENFGPADPASRKLVEEDRNMARDPDYGRMNHGITVVVL